MLRCISCWSFFFFFSSRRRHTRSDRDWSSDVCSSDLRAREPAPRLAHEIGLASESLLPEFVAQQIKQRAQALERLARLVHGDADRHPPAGALNLFDRKVELAERHALEPLG